MNEVLLSIAIPTYNRYKYLKDCIKTISEIKSDKLEIVISDNTLENEEIVNFISEINDSRIKYYHFTEPLGEMGNCEKSVSLTTGKYVCLLGDDDSVCPNMIKAAEFCLANDIDGCCFPFPGFNWPDMTFEAGKVREPNLFYKYEATGKFRFLDSREELRKSLANGGGLALTMPRLYHGMISRACIERVRAKAGVYFPGPSPDMANAVAVCLESNRTIYLSDYLIVSGYGKASARGEGNRKEHFGKIEDKPWLPKDVMEKWEKDIPAIFSGETIIAQSAVQSLRAMGAAKKYRYDYPFLYAEFFVQHPSVRKEILAFCMKSPKRALFFAIGILKKIKNSLVYRLSKHVVYMKYYEDVSTLQNAVEITDSLCYKGDYELE